MSRNLNLESIVPTPHPEPGNPTLRRTVELSLVSRPSAQHAKNAPYFRVISSKEMSRAPRIYGKPVSQIRLDYDGLDILSSKLKLDAGLRHFMPLLQ